MLNKFITPKKINMHQLENNSVLKEHLEYYIKYSKILSMIY